MIDNDIIIILQWEIKCFSSCNYFVFDNFVFLFFSFFLFYLFIYFYFSFAETLPNSRTGKDRQEEGHWFFHRDANVLLKYVFSRLRNIFSPTYHYFIFCLTHFSSASHLTKQFYSVTQNNKFATLITIFTVKCAVNDVFKNCTFNCIFLFIDVTTWRDVVTVLL